MREKHDISNPWHGGLDGLRAIAVLLVIAFHLQTKRWIPGGFIGVDLFFVLSGFLITSLLIAEYDKSGTIDLRRFYLRRVRRLMPAFVVAIALVSFVSFFILGPDSPQRPTESVFLTSVVFAFAYGFNWLVALDMPFMEPLVHLWSLSIEEQFYLIWPAFLLGLARLGTTRTRMRSILIGLIGLSISIPFWYWDWTWKRLYYASDFRAHALLAGCLLAFIWSDEALRTRIKHSPLLAPVALAGAGFLILVASTASIDAPLMYLGGFALVILSCAVILFWTVEANVGAWPKRILESSMLVWLGKRSYGLYLFHLPIVLWLDALEPSLMDQAILVCGATLLITEFSYRTIERPIMENKKAHRPFETPIDRADPATSS